MTFFIFGLAVGTFISALISTYYEGSQQWIKPSLLFGLSGIFFVVFLFLAWPLIKELV